MTPRATPPHTLGEVRILLVEDDEANRFFMGELLGGMGFSRLLHAVHGADALETLQRERVDLVLMDCQMPVMDGFEATRQWREQERARGTSPLPVVALTAYTMDEDRQNCLLSGMDDFLAKPVIPESLREVLARCLRLAPERLPLLQGETAAPDTTEGPLDTAAFADLVGMMGMESLSLLVETFLQGAPEKVQGLRQALSGGEREVAQRLAHTLKSNAGMMKAKRLAEVCLEMEQRIRAGALEEAAALMERVAEELQALTHALHAVLAGGEP